MVHRQRLISIVLLCVTASLSWAGAAQDVERVGDALDRGRIRYEDAMEGVRGQVLKALRNKISAAARKGHEDVLAARAELEAFNANGAWPDVAGVERMRSRAARAAEEMQQAYGKAIAGYVLLEELEVSAVIESELSEFGRQSDIVPWRELIEGKPEDARTAGGEWSLPIDPALANGYRLEMLATGISAGANVSLEIPLSDDRRLAVPIRTSSDGEAHALLSVGPALISADLGIGRPIDLRVTGSGGAPSVVLRIDQGPAIVQALRVKPLIAGEPEAVARRAPVEPAEEKAHATEPVSLQGTKWIGIFRHKAGGREAKATVHAHRGNRIVFRVTTDLGTRDWDFTGRGNALVLNECRIVKTTFGNAIHSIRVSGGIANGVLRVSGSWIWQGNRGGSSEDISLELHQQ